MCSLAVLVTRFPMAVMTTVVSWALVTVPPKKLPLVCPVVSWVAAGTGATAGSLLVSRIKNVGSITGPVNVT